MWRIPIRLDPLDSLLAKHFVVIHKECVLLKEPILKSPFANNPRQERRSWIKAQVHSCIPPQIKLLSPQNGNLQAPDKNTR